jgi:tetratricopeptide (TPR) repeat protein
MSGEDHGGAHGGAGLFDVPAARAGTLVGRRHELARVSALLDEVADGRGRLLLITGEAGIGKSRLADEISRLARVRGFAIAWGRCWEAGGAPAYWPWVQSIRALTRRTGDHALDTRVTAGAVEMTQLFPQIGTAANTRSDELLDPEVARFRLFESVVTFLRSVARTQPLLVVLDDLQAADTPSLLLLRFIGSALADDRLLILGTFRDTELTGETDVPPALGELGREPTALRLPLGGLSRDDVADLMRAAAGRLPSSSLVDTVAGETEGNPLFIEEVTRLLLEEGRITEQEGAAAVRVSMPTGVRDAIARRLRHLSEASRRLLGVASIFGREFALDALAHTVEQSLDAVLTTLDGPFAARVITEVPGTRARMRFAHVVIRECLYDEIGIARRVELHRKAAEVLERLYEHELDAHLSELAHHYFQGASSADFTKATTYAYRAGRQASIQLAYEEAVRMFQIALDGMKLTQAGRQERCELLLDLGDAQMRAGEQEGSRQSFLAAASLAEELGLPQHHARAALGYGGGLVWVRAGADTRLIPLLRAGLDSLGEEDSRLRARLLARLACAMRDDPSFEPRESIAREAVALARRMSDPATLAYALDGLYWSLWKPDNPSERLHIADESMALARKADDKERLLASQRQRIFVLVELGDGAAVRRELSALESATPEVRQAADTWWTAMVGSIIALLEGRFSEAEQRLAQSIDVGLRAVRVDATVSQRLHLFQIRREQGRLGEMKQMMYDSAREYTWYPMFRAALCLLYCDLADDAAARRELDHLAADDFSHIPFDNEWIFTLSLLSEVVHHVGDVERAAQLYRLLTPYRNRMAFAAAEGFLGSVSRHLGLLGSVLLRYDEAIEHFEAAMSANRAMGAPPWVAHTQHDLASLLLRRSSPPDLERAQALLAEARQTCEELGMMALQVQVVAAQARLGAATSVAALGSNAAMWDEPGDGHSGGRTQRETLLQLEGEYWTISHESSVTRLRDSKGMRVLARLLAEPGRPHPALDLERLGRPRDEMTERAIASADSGELLDDEARQQYRDRITELRESIEEAEAWGKADDAGVMAEELDFLVRELSRAVGIGGRARHAGSAAERARLNVTRAVKSALRRIAESNPELAAHLGATVHTGTVCVYSPEYRAPRWRINA